MRGALALDADVGPHVDAAALDAADVLRQAEDAVAVGALQVGLRHQVGHGHGVAIRQAQLRQRFLNECLQAAKSDDGFSWQDRHSVFYRGRADAPL